MRVIVHWVERAQVNGPHSMLNRLVIPPSIGFGHSAESQRHGRVAIEGECSVHSPNGTFVIVSKHGNDEGGYSERQGVICSRRHYRTGRSHRLNLILGAMATPQESLLVAPCRMRLGGRITRLPVQRL